MNDDGKRKVADVERANLSVLTWMATWAGVFVVVVFVSRLVRGGSDADKVPLFLAIAVASGAAAFVVRRSQQRRPPSH